MKFWVNLVALVLLGAWLNASAWADVGFDADPADAGQVDAGQVDVGQVDAGQTDAEQTDAEQTDAEQTDADLIDTGHAEDVEEDVSHDVGQDGEADAAEDVGNGADESIPEEGLRFTGRVALQGRGISEGVEVALRRQDDDDVREVVTDSDGEFSFEGLGSGTYELTLSHPGYVTFVEIFELNRDRHAEFELFLDADAFFAVEVVLEGPSASSAEFLLSGARETIGPETVAVVDDKAQWDVESLGVGSWTLRVRVEGYEDVSYRFGVVEGGPVHVRVFPIESERRREIRTEGGCGCASAESAPPVEAALFLALVAVGMIFRRRRR